MNPAQMTVARRSALAGCQGRMGLTDGDTTVGMVTTFLQVLSPVVGGSGRQLGATLGATEHIFRIFYLYIQLVAFYLWFPPPGVRPSTGGRAVVLSPAL